MKPVKKIKILEGIRQGKIGGGESYLLSLVENLDRDRFEPVVLSFTDGPMVERLKNQGISTHVIHTEKPFDLRVWNKVSDLVKKENINLVHAHGTRAMSNMFHAAKRSRLPLVYTCHAWSFHRDQNPLVKKARILSEKFLTGKAQVTICGAKANRDEAKELFGNFEAEIIYNSIDPQKFNPNNSYKNIRKELGIAEDEIVIASIARFTVQKQPLKLIEAFAEVCKRVKNVRLLMVGEGEQKNTAIELIAKLRLQEKVILQPFRQDVPDLLAGIDVFVLPSLWEAFPIALLEAMSMGKAVVATNVDGTPEMVQHQYNGLLINVTSLQKGLADSLSTLCSNATLRKELQKNAFESVYNKYNVSTLARKNEDIYQRMAFVPA